MLPKPSPRGPGVDARRTGRKALPHGVAFAVLAILAVSCSSDGNEASPEVEVEVAPATTGTLPPADSDATITVQGQAWTFKVNCYRPLEGEVLVIGSGNNPEGTPSEALVQVSAVDPYVGITSGDQIIEAALNDPLALTIEAGEIIGTDIAFVGDIDLTTGEGENLGLGSVAISCKSYIDAEPADF